MKKERKKFIINDTKASESGKPNLKIDYIHR